MSSLRYDEENNEPGTEAQEVSSHVTKPTKRQRWATTRVPGHGGVRKRVSIMDRLHKRPTLRGEKRRPNTAGSGSQQPEEANPENNGDDESKKGRRVYFNIPIPETERDEEGRPMADYPRNKIRTAKYSPLTFIPLNIWLQFHNIANIYFLFVIILNVRLLLFWTSGYL